MESWTICWPCLVESTLEPLKMPMADLAEVMPYLGFVQRTAAARPRRSRVALVDRRSLEDAGVDQQLEVFGARPVDEPRRRAVDLRTHDDDVESYAKVQGPQHRLRWVCSVEHAAVVARKNGRHAHQLRRRATGVGGDCVGRLGPPLRPGEVTQLGKALTHLLDADSLEERERRAYERRELHLTDVGDGSSRIRRQVNSESAAIIPRRSGPTCQAHTSHR